MGNYSDWGGTRDEHAAGGGCDGTRVDTHATDTRSEAVRWDTSGHEQRERDGLREREEARAAARRSGAGRVVRDVRGRRRWRRVDQAGVGSYENFRTYARK